MHTSRQNVVSIWTVISVRALVSGLLISTASFANAENSSSNWGGQYIGASAGLSLGEANPIVQTKSVGYFNATDVAQLNPLASRDLDASNFSGSLFLGANHQIGNTVFGVEADFTLAKFNEQYSTGSIAYTSLPARSFSLTTKVKSDWVVSLRPRVGYAQNNSLFYVSAGPALTRLKYNFTFADGLPESTSLNKSEVALGISAGVGYQHKLQDSWSLKAEYLFSNFSTVASASSALTANPTDGFDHKVDYITNNFRIGIIKSF